MQRVAQSIGRMLLGVAAMAATALGADLRMVGSDLLGSEFTREVFAFTQRRSIPLRVAMDGSRPGLAEIKAGRADVALIVLPPNETVPSDVFATVPLAYHAIVVVVPANCPLTKIAFPQLARVFGAESNPLPAHWEDLGVSGPWVDSPVVAIAPPASGGFLLDFFRHVVLQDRELKTGLRRYANAAELASQFSGEARPVALVATARQCPAGAKVVAVARMPRDPAVLATPQNLHAGAYPLGLPLSVVFRRERTGELASLLSFLLSDEVASTLERADLLSPPAEVRAGERRKLEQL